jgi:hypothetical protein
MALFQFFDFLKEAVGYVQPESGTLDEAGESALVDARYHNRIVCAILAALPIAFGLVVWWKRG